MDQKLYIIEIIRKHSEYSNDRIISIAVEHLQNLPNLLENTLISFNSNTNNTKIGNELSIHIEAINICNNIPTFDVNLINFYVYKLNERAVEIETLMDEEENSNEEVTALNHLILPNRELNGLWDNLIYDDGLKEDLLKFVKTTVMFSQKNINCNIISCNRLILLHGPPGTGKTSLSKALAQKVSIQMSNNYKYTHLFEINSHSLFSKWFSESGKLVMKLFSKIKEFLVHPHTLVCVLIDEVESITISRDSVSANEPSDCLRVVNALLTQLDQLKKYPNVLVFTTSNLTTTIDSAFLDRADIKQFIGNPSIGAIHKMFSSAIEELKKVKIIEDNVISENVDYRSNQLYDLAKMSIGLSGRSIRKLPFIAFSLFSNNQHTVTTEQFLKALEEAILRHNYDLSLLK